MNRPDEELMAYVDGQLSDEQRALFETQLQRDPELARRVESMRALSQRLRGAFDGTLQEPVPDALRQSVLEAAPAADPGYVDLAAERARRAASLATNSPATNWRWPQFAAMAATLLLGVLAGRTGLEPSLFETSDGTMAATGKLATALTRQRAGDAEAAVQIALTFRDKQGRYCRSFVTSAGASLGGVACRSGQDWRIELLMPADAQDTADYRMASSTLHPSVLAYVDSEIDGDPLGTDEESATIESNWGDGLLR